MPFKDLHLLFPSTKNISSFSRRWHPWPPVMTKLYGTLVRTGFTNTQNLSTHIHLFGPTCCAVNNPDNRSQKPWHLIQASIQRSHPPDTFHNNPLCSPIPNIYSLTSHCSLFFFKPFIWNYFVFLFVIRWWSFSSKKEGTPWKQGMCLSLFIYVSTSTQNRHSASMCWMNEWLIGHLAGHNIPWASVSFYIN